MPNVPPLTVPDEVVELSPRLVMLPFAEVMLPRLARKRPRFKVPLEVNVRALRASPL